MGTIYVSVRHVEDLRLKYASSFRTTNRRPEPSRTRRSFSHRSFILYAAQPRAPIASASLEMSRSLSFENANPQPASQLAVRSQSLMIRSGNVSIEDSLGRPSVDVTIQRMVDRSLSGAVAKQAFWFAVTFLATNLAWMVDMIVWYSTGEYCWYIHPRVHCPSSTAGLLQLPCLRETT
jgi:hypothetical protein